MSIFDIDDLRGAAKDASTLGTMISDFQQQRFDVFDTSDRKALRDQLVDMLDQVAQLDDHWGDDIVTRAQQLKESA